MADKRPLTSNGGPPAKQSRIGVATLRYQNRKYQFPSIIVRDDRGKTQCIMLDVCLLCPFCTGDIHARIIPLESRVLLAQGQTRHSYPPAGPDVVLQCEDLATTFARQFPHLLSSGSREHLQHCNVDNRLSQSADARMMSCDTEPMDTKDTCDTSLTTEQHRIDKMNYSKTNDIFKAECDTKQEMLLSQSTDHSDEGESSESPKDIRRKDSASSDKTRTFRHKLDSLSSHDSTEGESTQTSDTDSVDSVIYRGDTVKRAFPHDIIRTVLAEPEGKSEPTEKQKDTPPPDTIKRSPKFAPQELTTSEGQQSQTDKDKTHVDVSHQGSGKRKTATVVKSTIHQTVAELLDLPEESDSDEESNKDSSDHKSKPYKMSLIDNARSVSQLSDYGSMESMGGSRENVVSRLNRSQSQGMGSMESSFSSTKQQSDSKHHVQVELSNLSKTKELPADVTKEFIKLREKLKKGKPDGSWSYDDIRELYKNPLPGSSPFRHSQGDRIATVYPIFDFRRDGSPRRRPEGDVRQQSPRTSNSNLTQANVAQLTASGSRVTVINQSGQMQRSPAGSQRGSLIQQSPSSSQRSLLIQTPSNIMQHSPSPSRSSLNSQHMELDVNANVPDARARHHAMLLASDDREFDEQGIADAEREMERVVGEMTSLEAELEQMYRMTARSMQQRSANGATNLGDSSTTLTSLQERQRLEQEEIERLQELEEERRRPYVPDKPEGRPHRRKEKDTHRNVPKEEAKFEEEERRVQLWLREQQKRQKLMQKQNLTQQDRRRLQMLNEQRRQQFLQERVRLQLEARSQLHSSLDDNIPSGMSQEDIKRRQKIKEKLQKQNEQLYQLQMQALYRQQQRLQSSDEDSEVDAERQWQIIQEHHRRVLQQQMQIANQQGVLRDIPPNISSPDESKDHKQREKPPVPPKPMFAPPRIGDLNKTEETPPQVRRMRNVMFFLGGSSNEDIADAPRRPTPTAPPVESSTTSSSATESFTYQHLYEEEAMASLENEDLNYYDEENDIVIDKTGNISRTEETECLIENPDDVYAEHIKAKDISQMIDILERVVDNKKTDDDDAKSTSSSEDELRYEERDPEETVDEILESIDTDSYSPNATLSRVFTVPRKKSKKIDDVPERIHAPQEPTFEELEKAFDEVLESMEGMDESRSSQLFDSVIEAENIELESELKEKPQQMAPSAPLVEDFSSMEYMHSGLEEKRSSSTECIPDDNTSLEMERSISYSENTSETTSYDEDSVDLQAYEAQMSEQSSEVIQQMIHETTVMTKEIIHDTPPRHGDYPDVTMRILSPIEEERSNRSSAISARSSDLISNQSGDLISNRSSVLSVQSSDVHSNRSSTAMSSRSVEVLESPKQKAENIQWAAATQNQMPESITEKSEIQHSISQTVAGYMETSCDDLAAYEEPSRSASHSPRDHALVTSSESESGSLQRREWQSDREQLSPYAYQYEEAVNIEMREPVHIRLYPSIEDVAPRRLPPEQANHQLTVITDTLQLENFFQEGQRALSPRSPMIMSPDAADATFHQWQTKSEDLTDKYGEPGVLASAEVRYDHLSRQDTAKTTEEDMASLEIVVDESTPVKPELKCLIVEEQHTEVVEVTTEVHRKSLSPHIDETIIEKTAQLDGPDVVNTIVADAGDQTILTDETTIDNVVIDANYASSDSDFTISSDEDEITNVVDLLHRVKKEYSVEHKFEETTDYQSAATEKAPPENKQQSSDSDSGSEVVIDEKDGGEVYKVKLDRQSSLHHQKSLRDNTPSEDESITAVQQDNGEDMVQGTSHAIDIDDISEEFMYNRELKTPEELVSPMVEADEKKKVTEIETEQEEMLLEETTKTTETVNLQDTASTESVVAAVVKRISVKIDKIEQDEIQLREKEAINRLDALIQVEHNPPSPNEILEYSEMLLDNMGLDNGLIYSDDILVDDQYLCGSMESIEEVDEKTEESEETQAVRAAEQELQRSTSQLSQLDIIIEEEELSNPGSKNSSPSKKSSASDDQILSPSSMEAANSGELISPPGKPAQTDVEKMLSVEQMESPTTDHIVTSDKEEQADKYKSLSQSCEEVFTPEVQSDSQTPDIINDVRLSTSSLNYSVTTDSEESSSEGFNDMKVSTMKIKLTPKKVPNKILPQQRVDTVETLTQQEESTDDAGEPEMAIFNFKEALALFEGLSSSHSKTAKSECQNEAADHSYEKTKSTSYVSTTRSYHERCIHDTVFMPTENDKQRHIQEQNPVTADGFMDIISLGDKKPDVIEGSSFGNTEVIEVYAKETTVEDMLCDTQDIQPVKPEKVSIHEEQYLHKTESTTLAETIVDERENIATPSSDLGEVLPLLAEDSTIKEEGPPTLSAADISSYETHVEESELILVSTNELTDQVEEAHKFTTSVYEVDLANKDALLQEPTCTRPRTPITPESVKEISPVPTDSCESKQVDIVLDEIGSACVVPMFSDEVAVDQGEAVETLRPCSPTEPEVLAEGMDLSTVDDVYQEESLVSETGELVNADSYSEISSRDSEASDITVVCVSPTRLDSKTDLSQEPSLVSEMEAPSPDHVSLMESIEDISAEEAAIEDALEKSLSSQEASFVLERLGGSMDNDQISLLSSVEDITADEGDISPDGYGLKRSISSQEESFVHERKSSLSDSDIRELTPVPDDFTGSVTEETRKAQNMTEKHIPQIHVDHYDEDPAVLEYSSSEEVEKTSTIDSRISAISLVQAVAKASDNDDVVTVTPDVTQISLLEQQAEYHRYQDEFSSIDKHIAPPVPNETKNSAVFKQERMEHYMNISQKEDMLNVATSSLPQEQGSVLVHPTHEEDSFDDLHRSPSFPRQKLRKSSSSGSEKVSMTISKQESLETSFDTGQPVTEWQATRTATYESQGNVLYHEESQISSDTEGSLRRRKKVTIKRPVSDGSEFETQTFIKEDVTPTAQAPCDVVALGTDSLSEGEEGDDEKEFSGSSREGSHISFSSAEDVNDILDKVREVVFEAARYDCESQQQQRSDEYTEEQSYCIESDSEPATPLEGATASDIRDYFLNKEDEDLAKFQTEEVIRNILHRHHQEHVEKESTKNKSDITDLSACLEEVCKAMSESGSDSEQVIDEDMHTHEVTLVFAWPSKSSKPVFQYLDRPYREICMRRITKIRDFDIDVIEGPVIEKIASSGTSSQPDMQQCDRTQDNLHASTVASSESFEVKSSHAENDANQTTSDMSMVSDATKQGENTSLTDCKEVESTHVFHVATDLSQSVNNAISPASHLILSNSPTVCKRMPSVQDNLASENKVSSVQICETRVEMKNNPISVHQSVASQDTLPSDEKLTEQLTTCSDNVCNTEKMTDNVTSLQGPQCPPGSDHCGEMQTDSITVYATELSQLVLALAIDQIGAIYKQIDSTIKEHKGKRLHRRVFTSLDFGVPNSPVLLRRAIPGKTKVIDFGITEAPIPVVYVASDDSGENEKCLSVTTIQHKHKVEESWYSQTKSIEHATDVKVSVNENVSKGQIETCISKDTSVTSSVLSAPVLVASPTQQTTTMYDSVIDSSVAEIKACPNEESVFDGQFSSYCNIADDTNSEHKLIGIKKLAQGTFSEQQSHESLWQEKIFVTEPGSVNQLIHLETEKQLIEKKSDLQSEQVTETEAEKDMQSQQVSQINEQSVIQAKLVYQIEVENDIQFQQVSKRNEEIVIKAKCVSQIETESDMHSQSVYKIEEESDLQSQQVSQIETESDTHSQSVYKIEDESDLQSQQVSQTETESDMHSQSVYQIEEESDLQSQQVSQIEVESDMQSEQASQLEEESRMQSPQVSLLKKESAMQSQIEIESDMQSEQLEEKSGMQSQLVCQIKEESDMQSKNICHIEEENNMQSQQLSLLQEESDMQFQQVSQIEMDSEVPFQHISSLTEEERDIQSFQVFMLKEESDMQSQQISQIETESEMQFQHVSLTEEDSDIESDMQSKKIGHIEEKDDMKSQQVFQECEKHNIIVRTVTGYKSVDIVKEEEKNDESDDSVSAVIKTLDIRYPTQTAVPDKMSEPDVKDVDTDEDSIIQDQINDSYNICESLHKKVEIIKDIQEDHSCDDCPICFSEDKEETVVYPTITKEIHIGYETPIILRKPRHLLGRRAVSTYEHLLYPDMVQSTRKTRDVTIDDVIRSLLGRSLPDLDRYNFGNVKVPSISQHRSVEHVPYTGTVNLKQLRIDELLKQKSKDEKMDGKSQHCQEIPKKVSNNLINSPDPVLSQNLSKRAQLEQMTPLGELHVDVGDNERTGKIKYSSEPLINITEEKTAKEVQVEQKTHIGEPDEKVVYSDKIELIKSSSTPLRSMTQELHGDISDDENIEQITSSSTNSTCTTQESENWLIDCYQVTQMKLPASAEELQPSFLASWCGLPVGNDNAISENRLARLSSPDTDTETLLGHIDEECKETNEKALGDSMIHTEIKGPQSSFSDKLSDAYSEICDSVLSGSECVASSISASLDSDRESFENLRDMDVYKYVSNTDEMKYSTVGKPPIVPRDPKTTFQLSKDVQPCDKNVYKEETGEVMFKPFISELTMHEKIYTDDDNKDDSFDDMWTPNTKRHAEALKGRKLSELIEEQKTMFAKLREMRSSFDELLHEVENVKLDISRSRENSQTRWASVDENIAKLRPLSGIDHQLADQRRHSEGEIKAKRREMLYGQNNQQPEAKEQIKAEAESGTESLVQDSSAPQLFKPRYRALDEDKLNLPALYTMANREYGPIERSISSPVLSPEMTRRDIDDFTVSSPVLSPDISRKMAIDVRPHSKKTKIRVSMEKVQQPKYSNPVLEQMLGDTEPKSKLRTGFCFPWEVGSSPQIGTTSESSDLGLPERPKSSQERHEASIVFHEDKGASSGYISSRDSASLPKSCEKRLICGKGVYDSSYITDSDATPKHTKQSSQGILHKSSSSTENMREGLGIRREFGRDRETPSESRRSGYKMDSWDGEDGDFQTYSSPRYRYSSVRSYKGRQTNTGPLAQFKSSLLKRDKSSNKTGVDSLSHRKYFPKNLS